MASAKDSYAQVVKASSIMGGAALFTQILGVVRVKVAAVSLGISGIGLVANFTAIQGFIASFASLGLQTGAVREIAAALSRHDLEKASRVVTALQRTLVFTGAVGMTITILFAATINNITFRQYDYTLDIALIGVSIFFSNLTTCYMAVLQGARRLTEMARVNVLSATLSSFVSVSLYWFYGVKGVAPAILLSAVINAALSWYSFRKISLPPFPETWRQSFGESRGMIMLGLSFMWVGFCNAGAGWLITYTVTAQHGLPAAGLYSAAIGLSGILVNFILNALSADYYPRLVAHADKNHEMVPIINQQAEIGVLLAFPGLLSTVILAPLILNVFYSAEFSKSIILLQIFAAGCLGRIISWPLSYVMLAKGKSGTFFIVEIAFNIIYAALSIVLFILFGLVGVALGFVVTYLLYGVAVYLVARKLVNFHWTVPVRRVLLRAVTWLCISVVFVASIPSNVAMVVGTPALVVAGVVSLRGLVVRLGSEHPLSKLTDAIPVIRYLVKP